MSSHISPSAPNSERVRICISVIRACNLPNVDKCSPIDAYVKVDLPSCAAQRTKTIDNCSNPVWDAKLFFEVDASVVYSSTLVQFDLYDENTMKDTYVANVSVILNPQVFTTGNMQLPLSFAKEKYRGAEPSYLEVNFSAVYTFDSVVRRLQHIPGFQFNAMDKKLYVPFPLGWGPLLLGLEFEGSRIDVKVYQIAPATEIYLDMALTTAQKTKIRRRSAAGQPTPIESTSLSYYEEIKLDDVPASADFSQLVIWRFKKQVLETLSLDSVVREHGWKGAMSFATASKALRGVHLDQAEEAIYMPLAQGNCFLLIDFDKGNVDMKCLALETPANAHVAYDLAIRGAYNKKTSEVYVPSKAILGGKYRAMRRTELDDVPFGTAFATMEWSKYGLSEAMQISVADLVKLRPF